MNEHVLLCCLNQKCSLLSDMRQIGLNAELPLAAQLLQHGVDDDISSCPPYTCTQSVLRN